MMPVLTLYQSQLNIPQEKKKNYKPISHINTDTKYWQIKCSCMIKKTIRNDQVGLIPENQGWFNIIISMEHTTLTEWRKKFTWSSQLVQRKYLAKSNSFYDQTTHQTMNRRIFLNVIKSIYEKSTANIIINSKKLKDFPLRLEDKDAQFYHCYSTLYWKF